MRRIEYYAGTQLNLENDCFDISQIISPPEGLTLNGTDQCQNVALSIIGKNQTDQELPREISQLINALYYLPEAQACLSFDPRD